MWFSMGWNLRWLHPKECGGSWKNVPHIDSAHGMLKCSNTSPSLVSKSGKGVNVNVSVCVSSCVEFEEWAKFDERRLNSARISENTDSVLEDGRISSKSCRRPICYNCCAVFN